MLTWWLLHLFLKQLFLQWVLNKMLLEKLQNLTSFFLASVSGSSVDAFLLTGAGFSLMFFWASKNPEMSSGQSRFSSGSQVLSALNEQEESGHFFFLSQVILCQPFPFMQIHKIFVFKNNLKLFMTLMTINESIAQPHTREALPAQWVSQATHSVNPFHFKKNSTFPLTIRWSSTFSTTNSSGSSCVSSESFLPFCFLPMLCTINDKNES